MKMPEWVKDELEEFDEIYPEVVNLTNEEIKQYIKTLENKIIGLMNQEYSISSEIDTIGLYLKYVRGED